MQQAVVVQRRNRDRDVSNYAQRTSDVGGEEPPMPVAFFERAPVGDCHHDVGGLGIVGSFGDVMDADKVFVCDLKSVSCLGKESLAHLDIAGPVVRKDLDSNVNPKNGVVGPPNGGECASAQHVFQFVSVERTSHTASVG